MKTYLLIVLFLCSLVVLGADNKGEEKHVKGTFLVEIPSYMSFEQAKREALIKAQNQAIENAFGATISSRNQIIVSNENGHSSTNFLSISEGEVRGVWLGDKEEPQFNRVFQDGKDWLNVTVNGIAREIIHAGILFEVETLQYAPDRKLKTTNFKNGDDFFLYFRSPVDGFLTVFMFDVTSNQVFCLLPYQSSGTGSYPITHDEDYFLFAPSKAHPDDGLVDEVVLTCSEENKEELSEIYVVFSPNFYAKVGSKRGQQQLTEDLVLPSSLDYHSFNKWLIKYQQKDDAMQIKRIPLQIKKN